MSLHHNSIPHLPTAARRLAADCLGSSLAAVSGKRLLDITLILIGLPVILPLAAFVTLWIKLVSQGPAIFRQTRIGRDGRCFMLYKFRTMRPDSECTSHLRHFRNLVENNRPMVKLDLIRDPRLIPGGCLLRASGIDELPQLLNILRGEMSLVGPRPCLPEEYRYFTGIQRVRFQALPGLTGVWQVQGRNLATFDEMNAMDAGYVRHACVPLDLKIICQTPRAVCSQLHMACIRHRAAIHRPEPANAASNSGTLNETGTQSPGWPVSGEADGPGTRRGPGTKHSAALENHRRISDDVTLGRGVTIHAFVNLYGCVIGEGTRIGAFVEIQKGARIGAFCKISSHSFICEGVTIEDGVFIGHGVVFTNDRHPRALNPDGSPQGPGDWPLLPTRVRHGASIGSGSTILGGVTVGRNAMIGAGSMVTHDVPDGATVAGHAARPIATPAAISE